MLLRKRDERVIGLDDIGWSLGFPAFGIKTTLVLRHDLGMHPKAWQALNKCSDICLNHYMNNFTDAIFSNYLNFFSVYIKFKIFSIWNNPGNVVAFILLKKDSFLLNISTMKFPFQMRNSLLAFYSNYLH